MLTELLFNNLIEEKKTLYLLSVVIVIVAAFLLLLVYLPLLLMSIGLFDHDDENSLRQEIRADLIYRTDLFVRVFFSLSKRCELR